MPSNAFYTFQTKYLNRSSITKWVRSHLMYPTLTRLVKNEQIYFLNYGYAALDANASQLELDPGDEPNRFCIQLYQHVAGAIDLQGKDVLEVSCGHGGGANYITRYLRPAAYTGVDLNPEAIKFCRQNHARAGLSFVHGSAEALDFQDERFDAVVNVEASHCYGSMEKFLQEVNRVLRPGGHFLFTDIRRRETVDHLDQQLAGSGLDTLTSEDITANVLQSIELDNAKKKAWVESLAPPGLRGFFGGFARLKETPSYRALASREEVYLRYILRKPIQ